MDDIVVYILIFVIVIGLVAYLYYYHRRARELLEKWAQRNEYKIVRAELRLFRKGPFFFSGRSQVVFRVEVRDQSGLKRSGWVRCGTWFRGVFANSIESKMENQQTVTYKFT